MKKALKPFLFKRRMLHDTGMIHSLYILYTSCDSAIYFPLSLVPTCTMYRKNRGFLRFPDTWILATKLRRLLVVFTCNDVSMTEKF